MPELMRDPKEIIRDEMLMRDKILAVLRDGPLTITEIADAMKFPVHEVMYWVMAARKYGLVAEVPEPDDDYFQYALVENNP